VALVADAGTPLLSDPATDWCGPRWPRDWPVTGVPGANAAVLALTLSGLPPHPFLFLGFPPPRRAARLAAFSRFGARPSAPGWRRRCCGTRPPHRLAETLADLAQVSATAPRRWRASLRNASKRCGAGRWRRWRRTTRRTQHAARSPWWSGRRRPRRPMPTTLDTRLHAALAGSSVKQAVAEGDCRDRSAAAARLRQGVGVGGPAAAGMFPPIKPDTFRRRRRAVGGFQSARQGLIWAALATPNPAKLSFHFHTDESRCPISTVPPTAPSRRRERDFTQDAPSPRFQRPAREQEPILPTGDPFRGTVKWFNAGKGFGFVTLEDGADVFLHSSVIMNSGTAVNEGDRVRVAGRSGPEGRQVTENSRGGSLRRVGRSPTCPSARSAAAVRASCQSRPGRRCPRHRQMVQPAEGLRLHPARGRQQGRVRACLDAGPRRAGPASRGQRA